MEKEADVVIIGGGVAALQLARYLHPQFHVVIMTKSKIRNSNSYKAQGGIAAVVSETDRLDLHVQDTLVAGRYHQSTKVVDSLVREGSEVVKELIKSGLPVDRNETGEVALGLEGAHSRRRIVHCGGDATGRYLIEFLLDRLPTNVEIVENELVFELLLTNDRSRCIGVAAKSVDGIVHRYFGRHIVLATGGAGALYPYTSNHPGMIGDGVAMAYRAGAAVADMEFVQFHPTLLYVDGETKGLISEAVRGAGAILLDSKGRRIMEGVHPQKDLAPRHIVAYEIYKRRAEQQDVFLDISGISHFEEKFPSISQLCREQGVDLKEGKIPVVPGSHFLMGGIVIDSFGRTSVNGLYAIGETASSGVHGANRLASNSLLEGLVFGKRTAEFINHESHVSLIRSVLYDYPLKAKEDEMPNLDSEQLKWNMIENVGVIRDEAGLNRQLNWLPVQLLESLMEQSLERLSIEQIQTIFMFINSFIMTKSALIRKESRGAHIRSDFPNEDLFWKDRRIIHEQTKITWRRESYESHQTGIHA
ncbi:L-aspartate oxidase [Bacillus sp. FSL W8-0102]|uniref:L-aspartate oxidase n=1 Tax=Bacillus sp. FSL W8-0102 TaxID=2978205 RepID=UPI0030FA407D